MDGFEKRKDPRLAMRLSLLCRKFGEPTPRLCAGTVLNVGAGGLYFETTAADFQPGSLAEVRFAVPHQTDRIEFGGTMQGIGTVVRTETLTTSRIDPPMRPLYGVAVQFCRPPKLAL
ncbi:MAG TPA: PilZ domain-containing protein [Sedimentisphaerales bacterium]|nr:PilZ domain-containing protein [Sedimentisphaerales bacterium]